MENTKIISTVGKLPKLSFSETAVRLSLLCYRMDEGVEDLDHMLVQEFEDALTDVTNSVDRRKAFYKEIESKIEMAKQFRDEVTKHIKRYETIKERLVEVTKQVILANPDIPFKDSMGKQLKVIDNPNPRLKVEVPSNDEDKLYFKTIQVFDSELLKSDLLSGKKFDWAHLEYGKQLRGMK